MSPSTPLPPVPPGPRRIGFDPHAGAVRRTRRAAAGLVLALGAAVSVGTATAAEPASAPASAAGGVEAMPPETTHTHHPALSLRVPAAPGWAAHDVYLLKTTWRFDAAGQLSTPADLAEVENFLPLAAPPSEDERCQIWGAGGNQRRIGFPSTAIFVVGGKLLAASAAPRLLPLDQPDARGRLYPAAHADGPTWRWVPCVGDERVRSGHVTPRPLPPGGHLRLRTDTGHTLRLPLSDLPRPYLRLQAVDGRVALVPMRPGLVTVDLRLSLLVLQWQASLPLAPTLAHVHYEESASAYELATLPAAERTRAAALAAQLARCPAAATTPAAPEPCALPPAAPAAR